MGSQKMSGTISQLRETLEKIKMVQNPSAMIQGMLNNNPKSKELMEFLKPYNGDYEKAFRDLATKQGMPQEQMDKFIHDINSLK